MANRKPHYYTVTYNIMWPRFGMRQHRGTIIAESKREAEERAKARFGKDDDTYELVSVRDDGEMTQRQIYDAFA